VGEVEEERPVLVPLDEADRSLRVPGGEHPLVVGGHVVVDDPPVFHEWQLRVRPGFRFRVVRPHVVRVWQAE
jgi:hypothetical protein